MYPIKTEDIKTEHKINTKQYYRGEEDAQNTTKSVSIVKKENKVKQDLHEDMDKNSFEHTINWIHHLILPL